MRFLVDENVRKEVVEFLVSSGHDILRAASGANDEAIAAMTQETKRILLTHDVHFADILKFPPEEYSGIIRIKIHPPSAPIIINALKDFLQEASSFNLDKRLVILEEDGFRMR